MRQIVSVQFINYGHYSEKEYSFIALEPLNPDDLVVVNTQNGWGLAQVVQVFDTDYDPRATEYVIQKVDTSAYEMQMRIDRRAAELKEKMERKLQEINSMALYAKLAEENEEMRRLYEEYKKLLAA